MYVCMYVSYRSVLLYQDSGPQVKHVAALNKPKGLLALHFYFNFSGIFYSML